jgi:hypothetical protein
MPTRRRGRAVGNRVHKGWAVPEDALRWGTQVIGAPLHIDDEHSTAEWRLERNIPRVACATSGKGIQSALLSCGIRFRL